MDSLQAEMKINRRPKITDTEDDILELQAEYLRKKHENPDLQPSVQVIKVAKSPRKSLFSTSRIRQTNMADTKTSQPTSNSSDMMDCQDADDEKSVDKSNNECNMNDYIHDANDVHSSSISNMVLGDIMERTIDKPKTVKCVEETQEKCPSFKLPQMNLTGSETHANKSLFAAFVEKQKDSSGRQENFIIPLKKQATDATDVMQEASTNSSAMQLDAAIAHDVHEENLLRLKEMKPEEIMQERSKLLECMDANTIKFLTKKSKQVTPTPVTSNSGVPENQKDEMPATVEVEPPKEIMNILERSVAEHWINFNVVEKDKLEWMRDVPLRGGSKVKPNQPFEARFDWKGTLLPHSLDDLNSNQNKDDRDLYLHGEEPDRPGYTLQELFRLARSTVAAQRLAAYKAIDGMLNIYQQGFYDQVLTLPIARIFFLIRVGMDCNIPIILETVSKALATLLYNETDEALIDFCYENPNCHWQMNLQVVGISTQPPGNRNASAVLTPFRKCVDNVQEQLKRLKLGNENEHSNKLIEANIIENEEESEAFMTDFEMADKNLISCVLRTNIYQRIYFILAWIEPENSTVSSCLKVLIRLARTSEEVAKRIADNNDLIKCLFNKFLPALHKITDIQPQQPLYYNYPQYLCLKLMRVLISSNLNIAIKLFKYELNDIIDSYLAIREDFKMDLIKVQIECLRILRCLFFLYTDTKQQISFLPIFHMISRWHCTHMIYESHGSYLLRQHSAAILMAIASLGKVAAEQAMKIFGDTLYNCCCNWFNEAKLVGVKEFSQATLLSSCVNLMIWCLNNNQTDRVHYFINKYLIGFVESSNFESFYSTLITSSAILKQGIDRRNVNPAHPNFGSIVMQSVGPQLIICQNYPFYLLRSLWHLMELTMAQGNHRLHDALLLQGNLKAQLINYLDKIRTKCNQHLATNFYVKTEIKFIYQLLRFPEITDAFSIINLQHIVYNFLKCLTIEFTTEMEQLFEQIIFNTKYMVNDVNELNRWRKIYTELIYRQLPYSPSCELSLTLHEESNKAILPTDWPYFQFKQILQNFLDAAQDLSIVQFNERQALIMTLNMVEQLEKADSKLTICSPTETLMYLMIAFMGGESQFLDKEVHQLLQLHIERFISKYENTRLDFDKLYPDKCRFENLYMLFVEHFQAASYGDELFSALVMIPLAQKYDKKWRTLLWEDYSHILSFITCKENLLIGGLTSYLQPAESDLNVIKLYNAAITNGRLPVNTLCYKIAMHHCQAFRELQKGIQQ